MSAIGILGIGQMGAAAAVAFKRAGHCVLLWARDEEKLRMVEARLAQIEEWTDRHIGPAPNAGGSVRLEPDLRRIDAGAEAILECIIEVMEEKVALLRQLTACRERTALVMTATSGLSITEMGRGSGLERVLVGAHFWNPPHLIPVVEMVQGARTPLEALERACTLMREIGKVPVRCKDVPGFIGNRLMHAMWREALALVDAGICSAQEIDQVVKLTFALRLPALGPMENMDLIGLDAAERVQSYLLPELAVNREPSRCLSDKVASGDLGLKTGRGFYDWSKRDARKLIEERDEQIVRQLKFLTLA